MVYENYRIYGPYCRKDGRQIVITVYTDGSKSTVSYPKYLMEKHLNRYLNDNETVDHIDSDFNNNDISNLRVLDRIEHVKLDVRRFKSQEFTCPACKKVFELSGKRLSNLIRNSKRRSSTGPYCSKRCAGIGGGTTAVINTEITTLKECNRLHFGER